MKPEILTTCEFAAHHGDKLYLGGVSNNFYSRKEPAIFHFFIVFRIRYEPSEAGIHILGLSIINQDGNYVVPPLTEQRKIHLGESGCIDTGILNMNGVEFDSFGEYSLEIAVDGNAIASQSIYFLPEH